MLNKEIEEWLRLAGGKENVTRIEQSLDSTILILKDRTQMDLSLLASTTVEADVQFTGEQCRLNIKDVSGSIYNTMQELKIGDDVESKLEGSTSTRKKRFSPIRFVSDIFIPLMPVILGAGVFKILLAIIMLIDSLSSESSSLMESQTFMVFRIIGDSAFYLIPILAAVSTARLLKSNVYVAAVLGGLMFHPEVASLFSGEQTVYFLEVQLANQPAFYSAVIWVILVVCAAAYLERGIKRLHLKGIPDIVAPFLTLIILVPVMLLVLGTVGEWIESRLPEFMDTMVADHPILAVILMGAFSLLLTMTGALYMLLPTLINELVTNGSSVILGGMLVAVVAQAGASLALGLRSRDASFRKLAFWASGTALLGISQPAFYAVNMRRKSSFYAAILGGAAGGLYLGLLSVQAFILVGGLSLLELPMFVEEGSLNLLHAIVGVVIAFTVSCVLTYILYGKKEKNTPLY